MRILAILISLTLFCSLLSAQTSSASPSAAITAGPTNRGVSGLGYGFGVDAHRLQQVYNHDSFTTGATKPIMVQWIKFRIPANYNTGTQGGQAIDLAIDLSLGKLGLTAATTNTAFATNLDAVSTKRVFAKKKLNLPILGTPTNPSTGFDFKLPVDPGKSFLYLPANKRALILDLYNHTFKASAYTYYVDGWTRSRSGIPGGPDVAIVYGKLTSPLNFGSPTRNGTYKGCQSSAFRTVVHQGDSQTLIVGGVDNRFRGDCFVPNLPGMMTLGLTNMSYTFPGTSCQLVNSVILGFPCSADSNGHSTVPLPIPHIPELAGGIFLTQMFWLDSKANPMGLVASEGLKNQIGVGFPPSGFLTIGRGLITEFSM